MEFVFNNLFTLLGALIILIGLIMGGGMLQVDLSGDRRYRDYKAVATNVGFMLFFFAVGGAFIWIQTSA